MNKFFIVILLLILIFCTYTNIFAAEELDFEFKKFDDLVYRLHVPEDYEDVKYPVLIFLHGSGERGSDGLNHMFMPRYFADRYFYDYPSIYIAPQCPWEEQWVNWNWTLGDYSTDDVPESNALQTVYKIILDVIEKYNADINRIYITGYSMGGYGTWDMITRHTELFAAAVPICGGGDSSKAELLIDLPIWNFHGDSDYIVPISGSDLIAERMYEIGADKFLYTIYKRGGHDAWSPTYSNAEVWDWLYSQTKDTNAIYDDVIIETISVEAKTLSENAAESIPVSHAPKQTPLNIILIAGVSLIALLIVGVIYKIVKN
ncbi:MAG: prolyl oligopeptidase family serine peptidase [Oscillospiraceae bacterium]|nr:prolyl oligopeptidase family serine peptidase [Oscillospiraceae bacterium]